MGRIIHHVRNGIIWVTTNWPLVKAKSKLLRRPIYLGVRQPSGTRDKCGRFDVSKTCGPPRPVTRITFMKSGKICLRPVLTRTSDICSFLCGFWSLVYYFLSNLLIQDNNGPQVATFKWRKREGGRISDCTPHRNPSWPPISGHWLSITLPHTNTHTHTHNCD
jgi:hypothetical protein